ncbi:hypothetical protein D083_2545 [Dickeya solani RNS 08.23.3.1.A]|nr:hypothetical protein D083_2545 [Dickeya solani RNS 08.23.3.1.A]
MLLKTINAEINLIHKNYLSCYEIVRGYNSAFSSISGMPLIPRFSHTL